MTEVGPLVHLQISLTRTPWRITPAWSVLGGAIAVARATPDSAQVLRIAVAVLLGDLAWGLLRSYAPPDTSQAQATRGRTVGLPYVQSDSPLSRAIHALASGGLAWQGVLAGLFLALAGGFLLGLPAIGLSVIALLIAAIAWPLTRQGDRPAFSHALLDVLLPWTLGMFAAGWDLENWRPLFVAGALTILQWAMIRASVHDSLRRDRRLALGVTGLLVILVALQLPWAAATVAVFLTPPLFWLGTAARGEGLIDERLEHAGPWTLVVFFVAAFALR